VDGRDLGLERRVDEPVAGQERLGRELRRHNDRVEGLSTAACVVCATGARTRLAKNFLPSPGFFSLVFFFLGLKN
jgi:hypothetical protein